MDGSVLSSVGTTIPSWLVVSVGGFAGLLASFVMNWPMSRQPDGFTPAAIATAIVFRQSVEKVSTPKQLVVHHLTGLLAGVGYGLLVVIGIESGLPSVGWVDGVNILLVVHLLAVGAIVAFIYSMFAHIVLPRAGDQSYEQQATAIRGQWLRSSLIFGATLAVVVPAIVLSLP